MSKGYPSDWDSRRKQVYKRDNYTCQNCGTKGGRKGNAELHAHHIVPKSDGGTHRKSNLTTVCKQCHDAIHGNSNAPTASNTESERSVSLNVSQWAMEAGREWESGSIKREIRCPFCSDTVRGLPEKLEDRLISHWAETSIYWCGYSPYKDEPNRLYLPYEGEDKDVDIEIEKDWDEIADIVREKQESHYPRCPYCRKKIRKASAEKYITHWTDGSCSRTMESPPSERPQEIDEVIWGEINEKWEEYPKKGIQGILDKRSRQDAEPLLPEAIEKLEDFLVKMVSVRGLIIIIVIIYVMSILQLL